MFTLVYIDVYTITVLINIIKTYILYNFTIYSVINFLYKFILAKIKNVFILRFNKYRKDVYVYKFKT